MLLNFDFVCADQHLPQPDRQMAGVQAIGEILPFVLAKYGIEIQPTPRTELPKNSNDRSLRFRGV